LRFIFEIEVYSEETMNHLKQLKRELENEIKEKGSKVDYSEASTDDGRNKLKILLQNINRSKLQEGMLV